MPLITVAERWRILMAGLSRLATTTVKCAIPMGVAWAHVQIGRFSIDSLSRKIALRLSASKSDIHKIDFDLNSRRTSSWPLVPGQILIAATVDYAEGRRSNRSAGVPTMTYVNMNIVR